MRLLGPLATHERAGLAGSLTILVVALAMIHPAPTGANLTSSPTSSATDITASPTTTTGANPAPQATSGVAETLKQVVLFSGPDRSSASMGTLAAGVLLPIQDHKPLYLYVATPCDRKAWIATRDVRVHPPGPSEPSKKLSGATIIIDPGHGGSAPGAVGPGGHSEKAVNLEIATRVARDLSAMRTESVSPPRVFMTRTGDTDATLKYRTSLANVLNAELFLSIHNNAEPDGPSDKPGSETYHQIKSAASKRMSGLAWQELNKALSTLGGPWMADRDAGAKYRPNSRGGDYYGVLRTATVPSVLAEVLFISEEREEKILSRPAGQDLIAGALAKAVARYFSTNDRGAGFVEPYPRESGSTRSAQPRCVDPA